MATVHERNPASDAAVIVSPAAEFERLFVNPPAGLVGVVDGMLELCHLKRCELSLERGRLRVREAGRGWTDLTLPTRRPLSRDIMARIAHRCNEQAEGAVSYYGGAADLSLGEGTQTKFRYSFMNTPSEQRFELTINDEPAREVGLNGTPNGM